MNSEELYKNIVHYTNETSVVNIINDITGFIIPPQIKTTKQEFLFRTS